jgi:hypothetical protein
MEKQTGIWLDSEKAFLISLSEGGESVLKIESEVENRVRFPGEKKAYHRLGNMFVNPQKKITERKKHQLAEYFNKIIDNVKDSDEVLLFGPAKTKGWLNKVLHKHSELKHKVKGVENSALLTERQMIAKVKDFFKESGKGSK